MKERIIKEVKQALISMLIGLPIAAMFLVGLALECERYANFW